MATTIWSGAVDGNWNTDANWSGVKPVDNDTAVFPAGVSQSVTTGPTVSIDLDLLYIHAQFAGHIGSSGAPISLAADLIEHHGMGGLYVDANNGAAAEQIDEIRIMCAAPDVPVQIGGDGAAKGEIVKVTILRGYVTLAASCNFTAGGVVEVGYVNDPTSDVKAVILHDSGTPANTTIPVYHQWGGHVTCDAILTAARLIRGTLVKREAKAVTLDIYGGLCEYNYLNVDADNTIVKVRGNGRFDLTKDSLEKYFDELWVFGDGEAKYDDNLHTFAAGYPVTFGNGRLIKV